ncbi:GAF domain-containing protein [Brevibacterium sp. BRM-1]|uniref:GAF domain-containing protein n=1 Tax=Brevibacterium sp. BRM-1 TaxID=2999062 RepID=UPI0022815633|nr:GAF domain-containing protein [Brevibacterium sp. BRM-1]WAL39539.1 GAF domain-containing protein [Brevibacterium sp. BRM-1]
MSPGADDAAELSASAARAALSSGPDALAGLGAGLAAAGLDPAQRAAVLAAVGGTAEEASRLRQRGAELTALAESARILATETDVDAVLAHVVRMAHDLVLSDVAYLSAFDPQTGELRVRATHGVVTDDFARIHVPAGIGLASLIATTRRPQAIADYRASEAIAHSPQIDRAMEGEAIASIVGVPLIAGEELLGILFAGVRRRHEFRPAELAILSALADHAAIALSRSHSFRELRATVTRAQASQARRDAEASAERELAARVDALFELVLADAHPAELVRALGAALGLPATLVAGDDAWSSAPGAPAPAAVRAAAAGAAAGRVHRAAGVDGADLACAVVEADAAGSAVLAVALGERAEPSPVVGSALLRGARICVCAWRLQEAQLAREAGDDDRLVAALLAPGDAARWVLGGMLARGVETTAVARAWVLAAPEAALRRTRLRLRALPGVLVGIHAGALYAAAAHGAADSAAAVLGEEAPGRGPALATALGPAGDTAAASTAATQGAPRGEATGPGALRSAWRRAAAHARLAVALEWTGVIALAELAPVSGLLSAERSVLDEFVERQLGPLRRADAARGSQLAQTLTAYVRAGRSPSATARDSGYHLNTVTQRLRRIDALLGPTWREPERMFALEAAVRLDDLDRRLRRLGCAGECVDRTPQRGHGV